MAKLGFRKLDDLIGRVDLLEQIDDPENPKTRLVNLSGLLHDPDPTGESPRIHTRSRNERLGFEGGIGVGEGATMGVYANGAPDLCFQSLVWPNSRPKGQLQMSMLAIW